MLDPNVLVWIDLEMTGLNVTHDRILELAIIITDADLNILAEGPVCVIHQPLAVLQHMDEWNTTQHTQSGLVQRVLRSTLTEQVAEQMVLDFLHDHVPSATAPLCGNSVWQDRRFLARYMPSLEGYLHYRVIDVSTIKELAKRWVPAICEGFQKRSTHLALDDIRDSIAELRYYRKMWLMPDTEKNK